MDHQDSSKSSKTKPEQPQEDASSNNSNNSSNSNSSNNNNLRACSLTEPSSPNLSASSPSFHHLSDSPRSSSLRRSASSSPRSNVSRVRKHRSLHRYSHSPDHSLDSARPRSPLIAPLDLATHAARPHSHSDSSASMLDFQLTSPRVHSQLVHSREVPTNTRPFVCFNSIDCHLLFQLILILKNK